MNKKVVVCACLVMIFSILSLSFVYAEEQESAASKARSFWQKLFNYPAAVTDKTVKVASDTVQKGTEVATNEVRTVGQVTSGDVKKTPDLVTEPLKGSAETAYKAVEGAGKAPVDAAKETGVYK